MLKRNYFFLIPLLVVMAFVFGASGKVDAKGWPFCPLDFTHNKGPAIRAHMDFLINDTEDLMFSGSCGNITVEPDLIEDVEWKELMGEDDVLDKADLKGLVIGINQGPLLNLLKACYKDEEMVYCLKIVSVSNLTESNGEYSADVILLRLVLAH